MKTAIILATGPSLTDKHIELAKIAQKSGVGVFGMNHIWKIFPDLDGFLACNPEYYAKYWNEGLKDIPAQKWTWDKATAEKYDINFIQGRWADGFSRDHNFIHYGHSSGFQTPQIAVHAGYRRLLLCGYDMKFASDYDGKNKRIGSQPRHFFGEYPKELQHWPSVKVKNGVHVELIDQFEKVKKLNPEIEIINCSPGSAMKYFPFGELENYIYG